MEGLKSSYNEEAQARVDIWKYLSGFTKMAVVKCAVELGIPDILENHTGHLMTLAELSSILGCPRPSLYRFMRFLTHHNIFKEVKTDKLDSPIAYSQTALSRPLTKGSMASFILFEASPMMAPSRNILGKFLVSADAGNNNNNSAFETAHGLDIWRYMEVNPPHAKLFDDAMGCLSKFIISTVIEYHTKAFEGIDCLADVGGGNGTTLHMLVKACPWTIRAINFDLPRVVSSLQNEGHVEHVGGHMFESIPTADVVFLMSVLHNWDDEACVKILKNCKEVIGKKTGKVIIVDIVIDDEDVYNNNEGNSKFSETQLALDIEMMAHTIKGKQRIAKEWANVLKEAGFAKHTIKNIPAPQSLIEAYP